MSRVIIGVDPHKLSATIEVLDDQERVLGSGGSAPTARAIGDERHSASERNCYERLTSGDKR